MRSQISFRSFLQHHGATRGLRVRRSVVCLVSRVIETTPLLHNFWIRDCTTEQCVVPLTHDIPRANVTLAKELRAYKQKAVCTWLRRSSYEKNRKLRNSHFTVCSNGSTMAWSRTVKPTSKCVDV